MNRLLLYSITLVLTFAVAPETDAHPTAAPMLRAAPGATTSNEVGLRRTFAKRVSGKFNDHTFEVVNRWVGGLKLYLDGELIAENNQLISTDPRIPVISRKVQLDGGEHLVEVYVVAIVSVKIQIRVDGRKIGGDDL